MIIQTDFLKNNGKSLLLMLVPSDALIAEQERVVSAVRGQKPVKELHITLMHSSKTIQKFPDPPPFVELEQGARLVTDGGKMSVYLPVTDSTQSRLAEYVASLEANSDVSCLQNRNRLFHVSLSNLKGPPDESVANVWELPWKSI